MRLPGSTRNEVSSPTCAAHALPNPEPVERPRRRRFTAGYKLRIVQEADGAVEFRQVGALLRHEGSYSTQVGRVRTKPEIRSASATRAEIRASEAAVLPLRRRLS